MPNTKVVGIIFPYILTPIPNLYDHSFPRYGQITFLTFRRPTTLTFDLKFWKYLSVTVYPYVICMPSFIMIGWEMAEILHFEILRKHGQTHKQTDRQTWALQYLALPLRGRGNYRYMYSIIVKSKNIMHLLRNLNQKLFTDIHIAGPHTYSVIPNPPYINWSSLILERWYRSV